MNKITSLDPNATKGIDGILSPGNRRSSEIAPTIIMSINHAMKRSPQLANTIPLLNSGYGDGGATVVDEGGETAADLTGAPQFGQNWVSPDSSFPQCVQ